MMNFKANQVCLITALIALIIYVYGILVTITSVEKNNCRMTYMFEYPQFVKIHFRESEKFPKYNLFAYSEGRLTEAARNMQFNGAPVIYVPGNAGSFKQVRSFASVALRKGIEENWQKHLDYFTVDFDEEYSALFGGVLDDQSIFLELCIKAVLNLYKNLPNPPTSVSIVAHSMGGKVAQSVLMNRETAKRVNTVIAIASPIDKPVMNIDFYMEAFYRKSNKLWLEHRPPNPNLITNLTNTCCNASNFIGYPLETTDKPNAITNDNVKPYFLEDILFITIGGGGRDILVQPGLTTSQFSDVHVMSTCIPSVWLSTDHLASVWCLQQVLAVNRFLYSIIEPMSHHGQRSHDNVFITDKATRLASAKYHLTQDIIQPKNKHEVTLFKSSDQIGEWIEDNRRVFSQQFKNGLNGTYVQMIPLNRFEHYQFVNVEAINIDLDDWVFGCTANEIHVNQRYCSVAHSLTHFVKKLPSQRYERRVLTLDLHKIQDDYPEWTHIILVLKATKVPMQLNIDIHSAEERKLTYEMPSWYSYRTKVLTEQTMLGAGHYRINFDGLDESYQSVQLHLNAQCQKPKHHAVAKLCVPWTRGFERYHYFTDGEETPFYINAPTSRPTGYNTTLYPIAVDLYLDPECRYTISATNSFGQTASRIFLQFSHWIPSSGMVLPAIQKFPITVGFVLVSMAYGSCGGLALICAVLMYFILLSKMYEDYLEEFVFKTASVITEKLFGKKRESTQNATNALAAAIAELQSSASGTGLAFIIFTEAINQFPGAQFWAVLFFLMLFTLGIDSQFGMLEGLITSLVDMKLFPNLPKDMLIGILCLSCFLISIVFGHGAGSYIFQLMDSFAGSYSLLIIAFFECIAVAYVYGIKRFADDIEMMTGSRPALYWMICWKYISPAAMITILVASFMELASSGSNYPAWNAAKGLTEPKEWPHWCIVMAIFLILVSVIWIPVIAITRLLGLPIVEDTEPAWFPANELREVHGIVPHEPTEIERTLFCIQADGTEGFCCPTYLPEEELQEEE